MLHIVLYRPEIPPNTGNVIRLCANAGAVLHLVRPLGFSMDDARLRRAGLDYREWARVRLHDTLESVLTQPGVGRAYAFTARGTRPYHAVPYGPHDALVFGSETRGLPDGVLERFDPSHRLRIPMVSASRCLNLSNAVAVVVYEAWRQLGFPGAALSLPP